VTKKKIAPAWVSPKVYGESRNPPVTRQAVMRAIQTGRLSQKAVARTDAGHWKIDPEQASRDWDAWTDHAKVREDKAGGRPPAPPSLFAEEREERVTHARARAGLIQVDAELKRLDLEQRRGRLVDREAITRTAFRVAKTTQARLLGIPDRIAAELHAQASIGAVHQRLTHELAHALEALIRDLAREFNVGEGAGG
jgi:hypothetical protein